jgi:hypothetical protein
MATNEFPTSLEPHAVVETQRVSLVPFKCLFNAEVMWMGANYIVKTGCETREEAEAHAERLVKMLRDQMTEVGDAIVRDFPKAKA